MWLPTKVEETLSKMKAHDETGHKDMPFVVFTDAIISDGEMNVIYDSLWKSNHRNPEDAKDVYRYAVYRQAALGCTMMFNNRTRELALSVKTFPDRRGQHDRLLIYLCAKLGEVDYVDKPLIKYRQHGNNVTSYMNKTLTRTGIVKAWSSSPRKYFRSLQNRFGRMKKLPFPVSFTRIFLTMCVKWINTRSWNKWNLLLYEETDMGAVACACGIYTCRLAEVIIIGRGSGSGDGQTSGHWRFCCGCKGQ